ncbi:UbiD family decarboxylase [Vreelandella olivaria]|uniref:UbiD family decarboxylase n=1 Tax=Vreelandella olivaria TaxID=390919 RepID=UPI00201E778D|nr:UbiD family decarboxylase [Halomonas olivaria]
MALEPSPLSFGSGHNEIQSLRSFLAQLPEHELLRVDDTVEADYTATALVMELENRQRSPVVFLETPMPSGIPIVTNLFGCRERIAAMVGTHASGFNEAWSHALANPIPPEITPTGSVHDNSIEGPSMDAGMFPICRHFEGDAGRYISSGILVCKDPDTGVRNLSYQRLQLKGKDRFGASLHSRGHIWEHLKRCEELGKNLEVAVVIGVHPVINLAAAAKVAKEVDEYDIAGALLGEPLQLVPCRTIDVEVPAGAEIVLEGELLANENEDEGPFGEYTGYSTHRSTRNIFVLKSISWRNNTIYHDIIPGYSSEHLLLGRSPREAFVYMRLKEMVPNLTALNYPRSGTHFHCYIALKKSAEGQANQALTLLMGLDSYIKLAIAVDADVDVFNEQEVLWAMATRFQADTDLFVVPNSFCNRLDPSARDGTSAKLALDATAPLGWDVERAVVPPTAIEHVQKILDTKITQT